MSSGTSAQQGSQAVFGEPPEVARWLARRLDARAQLRSDSRRVQPGDAFFAWLGRDEDGRAHIDSARARGAAAIVAEGRAPAPIPAEDLQLVSNLREHAGEIASCYYGQPAAQLEIVAVTGTNGKTSCSHWIAQGLARAGRRSALIGTLGSGVLDDSGASGLREFGLTMPDSLALHAMLAEFAAAGAQAVVMEASSIGLHQSRLSGARPAVAVLTNLSRDHLDYHGSEEAYAQAKLLLFRMPGLKTAVLNAHDKLSSQALAVLPTSCRAIAYGHSRAAWANSNLEHLIASKIDQHAEGLSLHLEGDFGVGEVSVPLVGEFNAINALAVAASWLAMGLSFDQALTQLSRLRPVAGRLQRVTLSEPSGGAFNPLVKDANQREAALPCAVVDYAHTPDALEKVLTALRPLTNARAGKLWCVVGAGGERDAGKRPLMGEVASRLADHVILTSDNPRSEPPQTILNAIAAGLNRPAYSIEIDRRRAIEQALRGALPEDVVLIAGKGHERWQELAHERVPFDDVAEARGVLQAIAKAHHA